MTLLDEGQAKLLRVVEHLGRDGAKRTETMRDMIARYRDEVHREVMGEWETDLEDAVQAAFEAGVPKNQIRSSIGLNKDAYFVDRILARSGGYVRTGRM